MSDLYIIGGRQRYLRPLMADDATWYEYEKAIIIRLNTETGEATKQVEYVSQDTARDQLEVSTLFKSASVHNDLLYTCTQTEVLIYLLPQFLQLGYISLPCFNDVHHVRETPAGTIAVANAGLDMILEMNREGQVLQEWSVLGGNIWDNFSKEIDYRKISTKPHKSHPNFIFFLDDEMWATRFYQKDAISLRDSSRKISIVLGSPHDGLVHGDFIYFSTVNGNVVIANRRTLKVDTILNLNELHGYDGPLGWCRGLMVDGDKLWIGFSRIRPTKLRENVEWVKRSVKSTLKPVLPSNLTVGSKWIDSKLRRERPTHVACYDLNKKQCLSQFNVEAHGVSAIFSIFSGVDFGARKKEHARISERTLESV